MIQEELEKLQPQDEGQLAFYSHAAFAKVQRHNGLVKPVTHVVELSIFDDYAAHAGERNLSNLCGHFA